MKFGKKIFEILEMIAIIHFENCYHPEEYSLLRRDTVQSRRSLPTFWRNIVSQSSGRRISRSNSKQRININRLLSDYTV
jgi:hypothetical protein